MGDGEKSLEYLKKAADKKVSCAYNFLENSQFTAWREFVKENNIEYDYIYCAAPAVVVKVK